jgi:hypothetical protein
LTHESFGAGKMTFKLKGVKYRKGKEKKRHLGKITKIIT